MTLSELIEALAAANPELPLIFETTSQQSGPGYHMTEFKLAEMRSIDCGGVKNDWREMVMQILDGRGRAHMPVGKFIDIAERSITAIDGLDKVHMRVEFGHENSQLEILSLQQPRIEDDKVVIPLGAERAVCKPMIRAQMTTTSCCGAGSCC